MKFKRVMDIFLSSFTLLGLPDTICEADMPVSAAMSAIL